MRTQFTSILLLIATLLSAQDIEKEINAYVQSYVNTGDFNGCILITQNGETLFENCYGYANHSFQVENKITTKFKIGSVSKQFTAAAILILEQDKVLNTSDKLGKFYPGEPKIAEITLAQLLNHTSGIPDIYTIPDFNKLSAQKKQISEISMLLRKADLDFEPGTRYQYSNGAYALVADIIEITSGQPYQDFLNDRIFQPLKMNASGHNLGNEVVSNLAVGYDPFGYDEVKRTDYIDPELLKGSGSLYSTMHDLEIWINSIKEKSFLSATSYDKLLRNYGNNYGLGISLYKSKEQSVFGHDGRVNGYITDYLHYNESNITIVIMGNVQTGVADFFRSDISAIVFNKPYESRAKNIPLDMKPLGDKMDIIGTYSFGPGFNVYVEEIDGLLQARANEGGYSELILLEDGRFFSRTLYSYISFEKDDNGEVRKMIWTNNDGNQFEGLKK